MAHFQNLVIEGSHNKPILVDILYRETNSQKPIIIYCHGFKGFKDWGHFNLLAEAFGNEQFLFVKFNFSHNGTSLKHPEEFVDLEAFGNNNLSIELDDLGDVINWITSEQSEIPDQEIDKREIFLLGHSRGGSICILKANEDKRVKKIITLSAVSDYEKIWRDDLKEQWEREGVIYIPNSRTDQQMPLYYQLMENYRDNESRLHIPSAATQLDIPFLIVHGDADESVPFDEGLALKKLNPLAELSALTDATHTFGGYHPYDLPDLPMHMQQVVSLCSNFYRS